MTYYIGGDNMSGVKYDNWNDFVDALSDLAETLAENGEEEFSVKIEM